MPHSTAPSFKSIFSKAKYFSIFYVFDMTNPIFQSKANFFPDLVSQVCGPGQTNQQTNQP